jgi:Fe-S oxidoreductase
MKLPKEHILRFLAQNLAIRGTVLPIPYWRTTAWAKGLGLKRGGKRVIYTGHMYQLIPYVKATAKRNALLDTPVAEAGAILARLINPFVSIGSLMALGAVNRADLVRYNRYLKNIALLLMKSGLEFGYLYEKEEYAGALAWDLGLDRVFSSHARRLAAKLQELGVKEVITVDPHTTDILKNVYPKVVDGFDLTVRSFMEVLEEGGLRPRFVLDRRVALHDSCVYSRYLSAVDQPRRLLQAVGVEVAEPELSGRNTHCCGGPIESLFPEKAHEIAKARAEQLFSLSDQCVTMCPICHLNIDGAKGAETRSVTDISTYLYQACF